MVLWGRENISMGKNIRKIFVSFIFALIFLTIGQNNISHGETSPSEYIKLNQYTNLYKNHFYGYEMQVYGNMTKDESIMDVRTRFENIDTIIDIYYDDFRGKNDNFNTYINYGNLNLRQNPMFRITSSKKGLVGGKSANILHYQRNSFKEVKNDKSYYATAEIAKSNNEIVTVFMKSSKPIHDFDAILSTFRFIDTKDVSLDLQVFNPSSREMSEVSEKFMEEFFSNESKLQFGIFEPEAPGRTINLDRIENRLSYEFPVVVRYQHMDESLPIYELQKAKDMGRVVELTLQTTINKNGKVVDLTKNILDGEYKTYFENYGKALKELDYPVLFRLNNEMNGDWCMYSAYHYGKDADVYIALYRYLFGIFEGQGANNIIYVWNPNDKSFPNFSWNSYMAYYPGDEYVDIVGLTGYNTGNYYSGEYWHSFETIYDNFYFEYAKRFNHPFMITEFGSSSHGGDKSLWIEEMFKIFPKYDRIKIAIWWSGIDWDSNGNPARIYRIDENEEVLESMKQGLKKIIQIN